MRRWRRCRMRFRRLTSLPAETFKLKNRGCLKKECFADIVVFDPKTIQDHATFDKPHQYATGVQHVFVNGVQCFATASTPARSPARSCADLATRRRRARAKTGLAAITFLEIALMPVRIGQWCRTGLVQLLHLLRREIPTERAEVLFQLLFVASADDDVRDGRPLQ